MQGDRRIARLSRAALALLLGAAVTAAPALAQHRPGGGGPPPGGGRGEGAPAGAPAFVPPPMEEDALAPLPLFRSVCQGEGVRMTKDQAQATTIAMLPPDARRALHEAASDTPLGANVTPIADSDVPNKIYQIEGGSTWLIVPGAVASPGALSESCVVAWRGDDFMEARKVLFPADAGYDLPLTARPSSHANGALVVSTVSGTARLTLAAYNGWIVLRSLPTTPGAQ